MFTRTELGLGNEHRFYGVELVVYCEGDIVDGETSTLDEVFWTKVFQSFGRTTKCKSFGGKTNLLPLAQKVAAGEVDNVVVAMDSDYDHYLSKNVEHPRVLYSYGYSWENDVVIDFNFDVAISAFINLADPSKIRDEYEDYFQKQSQKLRRVFALDFKYILNDEPLFDRGKPLSIVEFGGTLAPEVNRKPLLNKAKSIGLFQSGVLTENNYRDTCGITFFYGKTVARMIYQWFVFKTKRLPGKRSVPYEAFMALITKTLDFTRAENARNEYFAARVNAI